MRKLLSSIALAALVATAVHADPGGDKGGGKNGANAATAPRGGNGGGAKEGAAQGKGNGSAKTDHGPSVMREQPGNGKTTPGNSGKKSVTAERPADHGRTQPVGKPNGNDRTLGNQPVPVPARDNRRTAPRTNWREYDQRGLVNGCPPGLAKKNNGCMPPGLAKQNNYDRYDTSWWGLRGLSSISGYRYYDGNLVRLSSGGAVLSYYPLLGGALAVGNYWPSSWQPTPLSPYYSNYYGLDDDYRYFDGAIYDVNPRTSAIQTIAALLTGDTFAVGQRMPRGYDVYNVPYQYRDRYADGPDAYYRYSDGHVYQTDPKTQLIIAVIELLN